MERPEERRKNAIDDLLSTGVWTSRRSEAASSAPTTKSRTPSRTPSPSTNYENTTKHTASKPANYANPASRRTSPRPLQRTPPKPVVEDELAALAKEISGKQATAKALKTRDPPLRGSIDQQPIILESEISAIEAAKLHKKITAELKTDPKDEASGERRFVFLPRPDVSSSHDVESDKSRRTYTEPKDEKTVNEQTQETHLGRHEKPPLERRRSRQDLPAIETKLGPNPPPFQRSTSAYAYTPTSTERTKTTKPAAAEFLLSPVAIPYKGQGRGKGFFDVPVSTPRQRSAGGIVERASTPIFEKRRSAGSSPTGTPVAEKRASGGNEAYGRFNYENGDKLNRLQQLPKEAEIWRSDRNSSVQSDRLELEGEGRYSKKSSAQLNKGYYTESDSDLADSSDSEPRRRKYHSRRKHHRNHDTNLRPNDEGDRHRRSPSKRSSVEAKPSGRYASPLPSPQVSPSQLPPIDKRETLRDNLTSARGPRKPSSRPNSRPTSRPVSPNSPYETVAPTGNKLDVSGTQKQSSRPRSRQSSPARPSAVKPLAPVPIPIPSRIDLQSPGETRRTPIIHQYESTSRPSSTKPSSTPYWQPPPFQPPESQRLEEPVGSYRRYSQDIEDGNITPLPPCPRIKPVSGYTDWRTLPSCPSLNICPSCFESTMEPTEFKLYFSPATIRSTREKVACDFGSQPWYRIAWLLTRKERLRDLKLFHNLAKVSETSPLCSGKIEARRKWYSILDPDGDAPVRNFDVCIHCVRSIEVLLPSIKGVFVRTDFQGPPGLPRVCDMRFDSKRFIHYFDSLETMADNSSRTRQPPDPRAFATLAKAFAATPECMQDITQEDRRWYMITQLPEFTVCSECYNEVVLPGLKKKKAIPSMFSRDMKMVPEASCQLYSMRMREIFENAVEGNDYKMLATKARERWKAEEAWKSSLDPTGQSKKDEKLLLREWRKLQ